MIVKIVSEMSSSSCEVTYDVTVDGQLYLAHVGRTGSGAVEVFTSPKPRAAETATAIEQSVLCDFYGVNAGGSLQHFAGAKVQR